MDGPVYWTEYKFDWSTITRMMSSPTHFMNCCRGVPTSWTFHELFQRSANFIWNLKVDLFCNVSHIQFRFFPLECRRSCGYSMVIPGISSFTCSWIVIWSRRRDIIVLSDGTWRRGTYSSSSEGLVEMPFCWSKQARSSFPESLSSESPTDGLGMPVRKFPLYSVRGGTDTDK